MTPRIACIPCITLVLPCLAPLSTAAAVQCEVQKLLAADGQAGDQFGSGRAVHGKTIVLGSPYDDDLGNDAGAAYVFQLQGEQWVQTQKLYPADSAPAGDRYGISVGLTADTLMIGSYWDSEAAYHGGSVYVYEQQGCLLYTSPSPRDRQKSRMPSSA